MRRAAVVIPVFALLSGAIAWGVLADARAARLEALLGEIEAAESRAAYRGVREVGAGETIRLRVASSGDGRRSVEPIGPRPRRMAAGLLRPGLLQWKERVKDYPLAVRNYDVVALGEELVAGRLADVYEARPRYAGRPTFRVAADREHRLALRFQVRRGDDLLFRAEFTEIRFGPTEVVETPPPGWLRVEKAPHPAARLSSAVGFGVWIPSRLPGGFALRGAEAIRVKAELPAPLPATGGTLAHLAYTDGLAVVSLVEMPSTSDLWAFVRRFVPKAAPTSSGLVAHKVELKGGAAYLLEVEGTVILAAGNIAPADIENLLVSLERR